MTMQEQSLETLSTLSRRPLPSDPSVPPVASLDHTDLLMTETAGLYCVASLTHGVRITLDRLTDQRGSVTAEISVAIGKSEVLSGVDLGLKSDTGQSKLAASLKQMNTSIPWKPLLQKACALVLRRHRTGDPPIVLDRHTPIEPLTYAINPLVFRKKATILYGDGGLGKSSLALLMAMLVATGQSVAGFRALPGKALYLDYEDSADVHARRLRALVQGHPELSAARIEYQRAVEPLSKLIHPLVRQIQASNITFMVLDSILAATGGDSSAEATTKLFAALRVLDIEILAIGHVPKTQGEGQDHATVYGSVFNQNFARSTWELKKEQAIGEDVSILGLFNWKSNLSRSHHPIGLKVTQDEDSTRIQYEDFDLSKTAELANALPLPNRIRNFLEDGIPRTAKEVADELGAKLGSVKTTLSNPRYKGFKWAMLGEGRETKWTVLNR